jgi:hypothetical protein
MASSEYWQVANVMLQARLAALAEQGDIVAHGDPMELYSTVSRAP